MRNIISVLLACLFLVQCEQASNPAGTPDTPAPSEPVAGKGGLRIVSPNGGEAFSVGDQITVKFDYVESEAEYVADVSCILDVYLWPDSLIPVAPNIQGSEGAGGEQISIVVERSRVWTVPESIYVPATKTTVPFPEGSTFKVRIRDYLGLYEQDDFSDGFFSIGR